MEAYLETGWLGHRSMGVFAVAQTTLAVSGKILIQNEGFFQVRYRDFDRHKTSPDFFAQFQWNGLWGLEDRRLAGINVRHRIAERRNADCYLSLGIFYQVEKWNYAGVDDSTQIPPHASTIADNRLRLNSQIKVARNVAEKVDFILESFVQTNLPFTGSTPGLRWFMFGSIAWHLAERVQLAWTYDHIFQATPLVPIRKLYTGHALRFGLKF